MRPGEELVQDHQEWTKHLNPENQKGNFNLIGLKNLADSYPALKDPNMLLLRVENKNGESRCIVWQDGECKMGDMQIRKNRLIAEENDSTPQAEAEEWQPGRNRFAFDQEALKHWRLTTDSFEALQKFVAGQHGELLQNQQAVEPELKPGSKPRDPESDYRAWVALQRIAGAEWYSSSEAEAEKMEQMVAQRLAELLSMPFVTKKYINKDNRLSFSPITTWFIQAVKNCLEECGFDCSVPEGMSTGSSLLLTDKKIDQLLKKVLQLMDEKTGKTAKFYQQIMAGGELSLQLPAIVEPNKLHQIVIIKK